ncbi:MAG TPA: S9 family peptidase [Calditrichia bacterium]|nr:S9 family peptidase [Calditrichia bacterium]HQV33171.1 S9 family peptidase [Calditrichia bacterium]
MTHQKSGPGIYLTRVAICLWLLAGLSLLAGELTPEMTVALKRIAEGEISPDGQKIAYRLSIPAELSEKKGTYDTEIYVRDIQSGADRLFVNRQFKGHGMAWSPDGSRLSFLAKISDFDPNTQIYALPLDGGAIAQLSAHSTSVASFKWSPDGKKIAFLSSEATPKAEKEQIEMGNDWQDSAVMPHKSELFVLTVSSGEISKAVEFPGWISGYTWAPDSRKMAFQGATQPGVDAGMMFAGMYLLNTADGSYSPLTETRGKLGDMGFSPDGKSFAWLGAVDISDPLAQSLFTLSLAGGSPVNHSKGFEGSATTFQWKNNGTILLLATEGTQNTLSEIQTGGAKRKVIYNSTPLLHAFSTALPGNRMAAIMSDATHPPELFLGDLKKGTFTRITHSNPELEKTTLARQEVVAWEGPDGLKIEGILTYPLHYQEGQKYPLALQIHGGPEGVSLNGWNTYATYPVQVLAANGYAVLQPNYRGSGGRGVAFSKADHDDLGGKEFEDVLAGIDYLAESGLIDPNQVVTGGWSYGGYFSAWAATRHSDRFKASVVAAGLTNWIAFSGTTDIPHEMALVHWNSYWYDQPALHWERSPLAHLDKAKTPTMLVHGLADDRVHPEQSLQLHQALKMKGIPTRMILYPRQPHGLRETSHQVHFIKAVLSWFDTNLGRSSTEKAPALP